MIAVAPVDGGGCGWYRILLPYMLLRDRGYPLEFVSRPSDVVSMKPAVLVLQRQYEEQKLQLAINLRKAFGTKLVFEVDDNFYTLPSGTRASQAFGTGKPATKLLEQFCKEADLLVVSTPGLRTTYAKLNANIAVGYNALDPKFVDRLTERVKPGAFKRPGQIRIGFAGSGSHRGDVAMLAKPLMRVLSRFPQAKLVFIGDDLRGMLPASLRPRLEYVGSTFTNPLYTPQQMHFDAQREIRKVLNDEPDGRIFSYFKMLAEADIDVAIAPLERTEHNRGKSWCKLLEYGAAGLPIVASRFGSYLQYAQESERQVVLTAGDEDDWEEQLAWILSSEDTRRDLAQENLRYIRRAHMISQRIDAWEAGLATIGVAKAA